MPQVDETIVRQGLDPVIEPYWDAALQNAQGLAGQPYTPYGGQRIAGFTGYENAAMQGIGSIALGGAPESFRQAEAGGAFALEGMGYAPGMGYDDMTGMAGQFAGQTGAIGDDYRAWTDPGVAESYMNPYTMGVTDLAAGRLEHAGARAQSRLGGAAAGMGAFGGSRHALLERGIGRDTRQQTTEMRVSGLADAYSQGIGAFNDDRYAQQGMRGLQLESMGGEAKALYGGNQLYQQGLGSLMGGSMDMAQMGQMGQDMNFQRLGALEGAGQRQRGMQQTMLDVGYDDFLRQQNYPKAQAEWMMGMINGFPAGATGTTSYQTGQGGTLFGDITGAGVAGYGAYQQTQAPGA